MNFSCQLWISTCAESASLDCYCRITQKIYLIDAENIKSCLEIIDEEVLSFLNSDPTMIIGDKKAVERKEALAIVELLEPVEVKGYPLTNASVVEVFDLDYEFTIKEKNSFIDTIKKRALDWQ